MVNIPAPTAIRTDPSGEFTFSWSGDVPGELQGFFKGFEVYYKFYDQDDLSEDSGLLDPVSLRAAGFRRMSKESSSSKPLIEIKFNDRDEAFQIILDFKSLDSNIPTASSPDLPSIKTDLFRGILDTGEGDFKPFNVFDNDDEDLPADVEVFQGVPLPMRMAIYVLSFGRDESRQEVYSYAVQLIPSQLIDFPTTGS